MKQQQGKKELDGHLTFKKVEGDLLFRSFNAVASLCYKRPMALEDVPSLPSHLLSYHCYRDLENILSAVSTSRTTSRSKYGAKPHPVLAMFGSGTQDDYEYQNFKNIEEGKQSLISETKGQQQSSNGATKKEELSKLELFYLFYGSLIWNYRLRAFIVLNILKLGSLLLSFVGPLLLGQLVDYFDRADNEDDGSKDYYKELMEGMILLIILIASQISSIFLTTQFSVRGVLLETELKGALMLAVFKNATRLRIHQKVKLNLSDGQINNILQIDIERAVEQVKNFVELWTIPLQVIIAFILLYYQVNIGFLAGVTAIVIMIPTNSLIAKKIAIATSNLMKQKDARVAILGEAFKGMLGLKCAGLEAEVIKVSGKIREKEVSYLKARKYYDAFCVLLWAVMPVVVPQATFVATLLLGYDLSPARVLTTLSLLNMLIFPMNYFPWILNSIAEGSVSASRIMKVIYSIDDSKFFAFDLKAQTSNDYDDRKDTNKYLLDEAVFRHGLLASSKGDVSGNREFEIGPVDLPLQSAPIAIIGSIGTGKSTLFLGCLKELKCVYGKSMVEVSMPPIAYVSQTPVLYRCSIQENIILNIDISGDDSKKRRYDEILAGCCLEADFEMSSLRSTGGDQTIVAHGAKNLSGGQRLRIVIARALFSSAKIVLLDDPFSALDLQVAHTICKFAHYICSREQRHLIIALQSESIIPNGVYFDSKYIVNGRLSSHFSGNLERTNVFHHTEAPQITERTSIVGEVSLLTRTMSIVSDNGETLLGDEVDVTNEDTDHQNKDNPNDFNDHDKIDVGYIKYDIIMTYFRAIGTCMFVLIILSTTIMQAASNLYGLYLVHWSEHLDTISSDEFIKISSFIVTVNIIGGVIRSFSFAKGCISSAISMYDKLVLSLFECPVSFFEATSFGQLYNRVGQDTNIVDDQLPFVLNIVLMQFFLIIGAVTMMTYALPPIIGVILIAFTIYYRLQKFYRKASRQLRRLDSAARSPVYAKFIECIDDGPTIRSLQIVKYFEDKFVIALNRFLSINLIRSVGAQWLNVRLQLIGCFISSSVAMIAIILSVYGFLEVSGALLGLALVYSLSIVNNLNGLMNSFADTEQAMISVERIVGYINLDSENDGYDNNESHGYDDNDSDLKSSNSTFTYIKNPLLSSTKSNSEEVLSSQGRSNLGNNMIGHINMKNMSMRYAPSLPLTLNNITLEIAPGEKLIVIGRTGSGKSSLLRVLLKLNEYTGSVYVNGKELKPILPSVVRTNYTVIPQDPLIFTGTVAFNLDISQTKSKFDLNRAVDAIGLKKTLYDAKHEYNEDILDYQIKDGGANLSQGQKQLICLGRALLCSSSILLVDEATANLDYDAEKMFYQVLSSHFQKSTIIMISHKVSEAMKFCDTLIEMENGNIKSSTKIEK